MKPNTRLQDSEEGRVDLRKTDVAEAWDIAKDVVDYPVRIVNAYFKLDENDETSYRSANGATPQGRDKMFNLVLVDKLRVGDEGLQAIATVTDKYGTVKTADIYEDFRQQLQEINQKHIIRQVYVSGNGGVQTLVVQMQDKKALNTPDGLIMEVRLNTSVDGTLSHSLTLSAYNASGDTSIYVYGGEYNLSARHTTTLGERTVDFIPQFKKMLEYWDTVIIPTMSLMCEDKFDRKAAVEFLNQVAEDAGIGERHREKITSLYASPAVHTNEKNDSVYRVNQVLNQYIDEEMSGRPELQGRFKTAVAKRIYAYVQKKKIK